MVDPAEAPQPTVAENPYGHRQKEQCQQDAQKDGQRLLPQEGGSGEDENCCHCQPGRRRDTHLLETSGRGRGENASRRPQEERNAWPVSIEQNLNEEPETEGQQAERHRQSDRTAFGRSGSRRGSLDRFLRHSILLVLSYTTRSGVAGEPAVPFTRRRRTTRSQAVPTRAAQDHQMRVCP